MGGRPRPVDHGLPTEIDRWCEQRGRHSAGAEPQGLDDASGVGVEPAEQPCTVGNGDLEHIGGARARRRRLERRRLAVVDALTSADQLQQPRIVTQAEQLAQSGDGRLALAGRP